MIVNVFNLMLMPKLFLFVSQQCGSETLMMLEHNKKKKDFVWLHKSLKLRCKGEGEGEICIYSNERYWIKLQVASNFKLLVEYSEPSLKVLQ
jgi:hypothetical protein